MRCSNAWKPSPSQSPTLALMHTNTAKTCCGCCVQHCYSCDLHGGKCGVVCNCSLVRVVTNDFEWSGMTLVAFTHAAFTHKWCVFLRLNVTAFQCKNCGTTSERRKPECRQHDVQRVTATKRWWQCCHCNNRFSTVAVRLPKTRCPK